MKQKRAIGLLPIFYGTGCRFSWRHRCVAITSSVYLVAARQTFKQERKRKGDKEGRMLLNESWKWPALTELVLLLNSICTVQECDATMKNSVSPAGNITMLATITGMLYNRHFG